MMYYFDFYEKETAKGGKTECNEKAAKILQPGDMVYIGTTQYKFRNRFYNENTDIMYLYLEEINL